MEIIKIDSADSTNTWVSRHEEELPSPALVYSHRQTAGRGQRGNHWESEPGKNITATLLFHPSEFPACDQFAISEAVALAVVDFLEGYGVKAKIKWPNDIYVEDKKICGILVEHTVMGSNIMRTIAGMGININQREFLSDAPNPVSMTQLTGLDHDLEEAVANLAKALEKRIAALRMPEILHGSFLDHLWRKDKRYHKFYDRNSNEPIRAKIIDVKANGLLTLETSEGDTREFAFKEVEFILE